MIDVKEVAKIFAVSEKTIYRWLAKKEIPAYKIGESYRFNRVELLEWANSRKIPVSQEIFNQAEDKSCAMLSISDALHEGGIHYNIASADKPAVINAIVGVMNLPDDIDRKFLAEALLARENLGTTAIGDGIAIPHVRNPVVFNVTNPVLSLCFLKRPIDFEAVDKKPVDTLFTIITPTVRSHLLVLSRLSCALTKSAVRRVINSGSTDTEILDALSVFEKNLMNTDTGN
jgi:PTS system nitrogen regulatory IIA component